MLEVAGAHWGALAPGPELALLVFPTAAGACCSRGLRVGGADTRVVAEVSRVVFDAGAGGRAAPRALWAAHHLTCWERGMQQHTGGEKVAKGEIDAGGENVDRRKEKRVCTEVAFPELQLVHSKV